MTKAIVTLATGEYQELWKAYALPTWQAFCDRQGYELVVFHEPLDTCARAAGRSMAWQKLICHEHPRLQGVDQLIWLDADIVVNPGAPDPLLKADLEKINACLEFDWGRDAQLAPIAQAWRDQQCRSFEEQYPGHRFEGYPQLWGFGEGAGPLINTGFLLFSPHRYGDLLRHVYDHYDDADVMHWGEMVPLSEEIHRAGLFHAMDPRFNMLIVPFLASLLTGSDQSKMRIMATASIIYRALNNNYFLHFAGYKFLGLRFMTGASWDGGNGFQPNVPAIVATMKANLEANGLSMLDDI
ncbi:hypothetical protein N8501_01460 [Synechococcus sp. AH-601-N10]|nr:hypothetical protein [Synechococcus sp. AH-601-N10]